MTNAVELKTAVGKFQNHYLTEINTLLPNLLGRDVSAEEKRIVYNSLVEIANIAQDKGIALNQIKSDSVINAIQVLIGGGFDPARTKNVYFTPRDNKDGTYTIEVAPQAYGFYHLLLKFGANVGSYVTTWLIREGDEFTSGEWVGIEQTPPKWKSFGTTKKVVRVVVIIRDKDGNLDFSLQAERDNVIPSIIGQLRNSHRYYPKIDEVIEDIQKIGNLDKVFEKYLKYKYSSSGKEVYLFGPAWRDHTEKMVERKMVNFAVKQRPQFETTNALEKKAVDILVYETPIDQVEEVVVVENGKQDVTTHFEEAKTVGKKFEEVEEETIEEELGDGEVLEEDVKEETVEETETEDEISDDDVFANFLKI